MTGNSWHSGVKSNRRVGVRPTGVLAGALLVAAGLLALAVAGWGVMELSILWGAAAILSLIGVLVLTLRGFPLFAILAAVAGAVTWGAATRSWLPDGWMDIVGLLKFIGVNLGFDVPLIGAFLAALMLDARRLSRAAIDEAVSGRRWWGKPDDHLPRLKELEALPSARFFALGEGGCTHLVVAGRRVALFLPTVWPHGEFTMDASGQVLRGGRLFVPGSEDVDGLAAEVHTWREQLGKVGGAVRGYLVVAPSRGDVSEDLVISVAPGEHLHLVHAHEMVEAAGRWLAAEPYRVELSVMERLLVIASGNKLPEPSPLARSFARPAPAPAAPTDASLTVADAAFDAAAGTDGPAGAEPGSLRGRLTRGRFGRSTAGDTSRADDRADGAFPVSPSPLEDDIPTGNRGGDFDDDGAVRDRFGRTHRDPDPIVPANDSWESRATRELVGSWDSESANKLAAWAADSSPAPSSATSRDDRLTFDDFGGHADAVPDLDDEDHDDAGSRRPWSSSRAEPSSQEPSRRVGRRRADPEEAPAVDWGSEPSAAPPPPADRPSASRPPSSPPQWPAAPASPLSGVSATGSAPEPPPDRFASLMSEFDRLANDPDRFGFAMDDPEGLDPAPPRDPDPFAADPGPRTPSERTAPTRAWSSEPDGGRSDRDRASDLGGAPDRDRPGRAPADGGRFSTGAGERPARRPAERPAWTGSLFDGDKPELVAEPLELRRSWDADPAARSMRRRDISGAPTSGVPTSGGPRSSGPAFTDPSATGSWPATSFPADPSSDDPYAAGSSSARASSAGPSFNGPSAAWPVSAAPTSAGPATPAPGARSEPFRADPAPAEARSRFGPDPSARPEPAWDPPAPDDPSRRRPGPLPSEHSWSDQSGAERSRSESSRSESWSERSRSDAPVDGPSSGSSWSGAGLSEDPRSASWSGSAQSESSWSGSERSDQSRSESSWRESSPVEAPSGSFWSDQDRSDPSPVEVSPSDSSWSQSQPPSASWSDTRRADSSRPGSSRSDQAPSDPSSGPSWPGSGRSDQARSGPSWSDASPSSSWSGAGRPEDPRSAPSRPGLSRSEPSWSSSGPSDQSESGSSWSEPSPSESSRSDSSRSDSSWSESSRYERSRSDVPPVEAPTPESSWSEAGPSEDPRSASSRSGLPRSESSWSSAARSDQARPAQARPAQARPGQVRLDQAWPEQARSAQGRPDQARPDQARPDQARPDQARPDQARPDQARSAQTRPGQSWPDQLLPDQAPSDQLRSDQARPGQARPDQAAVGGSWPERSRSEPARGEGLRSEPVRGDGRRGEAEAQPGGWGAAPAGDEPAWWDADAAQGAPGRIEEEPAEQPAARGKRSLWGRSKAGKGRKGQAAEPAPSANGSPDGRAGAAAGDDWASEAATGRGQGSGRPAWATDPTSGYESDPSGEFTSESRSRATSRPAVGGSEQEQGGAAVPGQRQRARDMLFDDDDVAPLELNLDEEPKAPDQRSRRFLRRK